MTVHAKDLSRGEAPDDSSGVPGDEGNKNEQSTVSYETHRKLLSEKKKRDEELDALKKRLGEFESKEKERTEQELKQKEDFKSLLALRDKELQETKSRLTELTTQQVNALKLESFLSAIDGKIDRKYWGHIDLDKIKLNPDSGDVDEMSVTALVDQFKKEYPEIIKVGRAPGLPPNSPQPSGGPLSYEQWLKLPLAEKKKRMAEVMSKE